MKFDNIDGNGRLWAVKYDEVDVNVLGILFRNWSDVDWLADFFISNKVDLERNFQITNVIELFMTHCRMRKNWNV